jgi:hypothetical protein
MSRIAQGLASIILAGVVSHKALAQGCPVGQVVNGPDAIYKIDGGKARPLVGLNTFNQCVGNMGNLGSSFTSQQIATQWPAGDPYIAMGTFLCDDVGASDNHTRRCGTNVASGPLCGTIYWMDTTTDVPRPFGDWGAYKNQGGPDCPEVSQLQGGVVLLPPDPNNLVTKYVHAHAGGMICSGTCKPSPSVLYGICRAGADRCTMQTAAPLDTPCKCNGNQGAYGP